MAEFVVPDFLQNTDVENLHAEMVEKMPADIDMSWGGHPYNLTYPTAYLTSMILQFTLTEAIKLLTPQHCQGYDEIAEYHGETRGVIRKEAIHSSGNVEIKAKEGTEIIEGSQVATLSVNNAPSVYFKTLETVTYESDTVKTVTIEAVEAGKAGNVAANTITLFVSDIDGIESVTNPEPTTGGMDEEDLDEYIERIVEFDRSQGQSYIGNDADYIRWAKETENVDIGSVQLIHPTTDDGIISIVLTNGEGEPSSTEDCAAVYNHIMDPTPLSTDGTQPENEITGLNRLAPINAYIQVIPHTTIPISISASIIIDTDITTLEAVTEALYLLVKEHLKEATEYVYISQIGSLITKVDGVKDYDINTLLINEQSDNITIPSDSKPTISKDAITLTLL